MNESISRPTVTLAEAYLRAHIDAPVPVSLLNRLVGLSERGLRDAFYRVRGMSPKRWIVSERLQGASHARTDVWAERPTVTDVAADYGFYEPGRFAATYPEGVGEAPSVTLRSPNQRAGATPRRMRTRQCLRQHVRYPGPLLIRSNNRPSTRRGTPL